MAGGLRFARSVLSPKTVDSHLMPTAAQASYRRRSSMACSHRCGSAMPKRTAQ